MGGKRRRASILRHQGYCRFSRSVLRMRLAVSSLSSLMTRGVDSAGCGLRSKWKCSGIRTQPMSRQLHLLPDFLEALDEVTDRSGESERSARGGKYC